MADRVIGFAIILIVVLTVMAAALGSALVTLAAYDAKLGRPFRLGTYLSIALRNLVPLAICSIIVAVLAGLAAIALIIPALWVGAVFSVVAPAIVIERLGFEGLGRSVELTKDYRWPIVGCLVVVWGCASIFSGALSAIVDPVVSGINPVVGVVLTSVVDATTMGFAYMFPALLYARLREIKEGMTPDKIVDVFS